MRIKEFNAPVAENISRLIGFKGLKQIYVAEKAGYKAQELNDMLNGRRLIKVCDVPKIALALDVEIDEIYATGMKGSGRMRDLEKYSTKELFEELKVREGVHAEYAEPHQDKKISVNGPAEILIIVD